MSADTCVASIYNGHRFYTCGRPAKGTLKNGNAACGVHLAAERRREKNDAARREQADRDHANYVRLRAICDEVNQHVPGLDAHVLGGKLRVDADALLEFVTMEVE